jgi:hypothetical protein
MSLAIRADLETKIREQAESEGLTVEAYLERLVAGEQQSLDDLEKLALEGLNSGAPIKIGPSYWENKHKQLDKRLNNPITQ